MTALWLLTAIVAQGSPVVMPWHAEGSDGYLAGEGRLGFESQSSEPKRRTLIRVRDPKLPSSRFVLKTFAGGGVTDEGSIHLEMTVVAADGERVVVRTLDTGGPMAPLKGKFAREIELPFVSNPIEPPREIIVELVSRGGIRFELAPFTIEPWPRWSLTWLAAGGFAGALGVLIGVLGGVYGLLAAIPASRRMALAFGKTMALLGFVLIAAAPCLYAASLPFGIWVPVGVAGVVCMLAFGGTLPMIKKGIESANRMNAAADPALEPS